MHILPSFPTSMLRESMDVQNIHPNNSAVPCHFHTVVLLEGPGHKRIHFWWLYRVNQARSRGSDTWTPTLRDSDVSGLSCDLGVSIPGKLPR